MIDDVVSVEVQDREGEWRTATCSTRVVCGWNAFLVVDESASNYNELACGRRSCLYATTFNVDMNRPFNPGALKAPLKSRFVRTGPLLGLGYEEGDNQLTDEDGDNISL